MAKSPIKKRGTTTIPKIISISIFKNNIVLLLKKTKLVVNPATSKTSPVSKKYLDKIRKIVNIRSMTNI
jgi:hypothetical protein